MVKTSQILWSLHSQTLDTFYHLQKSHIFDWKTFESLSEPTIFIRRQITLYQQLGRVQPRGCFTWATDWAAFYRYQVNRYACTDSSASNLDLVWACRGSVHCMERVVRSLWAPTSLSVLCCSAVHHLIIDSSFLNLQQSGLEKHWKGFVPSSLGICTELFESVLTVHSLWTLLSFYVRAEHTVTCCETPNIFTGYISGVSFAG